MQQDLIKVNALPIIIKQSDCSLSISKTTTEIGEDVDLSGEADPHTVTGLLKYYFRELPEPLMTFALYPNFISAAGTQDI